MTKRGLTQHPLMRVLSLIMAFPMAGILLLHPALMLDQNGHYSHPLLMLIMLGVAGGLVHGMGYDPVYRLWRILFGPWVAWPLMLLGYGLLLKVHVLS